MYVCMYTYVYITYLKKNIYIYTVHQSTKIWFEMLVCGSVRPFVVAPPLRSQRSAGKTCRSEEAALPACFYLLVENVEQPHECQCRGDTHTHGHSNTGNCDELESLAGDALFHEYQDHSAPQWTNTNLHAVYTLHSFGKSFFFIDFFSLDAACL